MDIIVISGLWLDETVWGDVAAELEREGHVPIPLRLPGYDRSDTQATFDDQVAALLDAVDAADRPIVVGHSAACTLAWVAADRRPTAIAGVMLIGGFPASDGATYADFFAVVDGVMPFPGWEPFDGPDSADLDEATKERLAADAIPVPEGVSRGIVGLADERRFDVPVVVVCPEYGPDDAKAWIDAGDVPELARATNVRYRDIDSGHWPMITRPLELARLIGAEAASASRTRGDGT